MIRHIPNLLTLSNLFCGCLGVYTCATGDYKAVPFFIALSLTADFFDGLSARALKIKSELGLQLDSLADMVSFGVLPGTMIVQLIGMSNMPGSGSFSLNPISFLGYIFTLFACLRLAKFNLDTRQTSSFRGLATPAATVFILGIYLHFFNQGFNGLPTFSHSLLYQTSTILLMTAGLCALMVSEIKMFSFKVNIFKWKENSFKIIFLIFSIILLAIFKEIGLSYVIVFYIISSIFEDSFSKLKDSRKSIG